LTRSAGRANLIGVAPTVSRALQNRVKRTLAQLGPQPTIQDVSKVLHIGRAELLVILEKMRLVLPDQPFNGSAPIERSAIEAVIKQIQEAGKPVTVTACAILLGVSTPRLSRFWALHGFPKPKRGKPPRGYREDATDQLIRGWRGDDAELARKLGCTREAIRQRRKRLGIRNYEAQRKFLALQALNRGIRPAIVAVQFGFTSKVCRKWLLEATQIAPCLCWPCVKRASVRAQPQDLFPTICRTCHSKGLIPHA